MSRRAQENSPYWPFSRGIPCWKVAIFWSRDRSASSPGKENTYSSPCSRKSTESDDGILSLLVLQRKTANRPWQHVLHLTRCFLTIRTLKFIQPRAIRIKPVSFLMPRRERSSAASDYGPW